MSRKGSKGWKWDYCLLHQIPFPEHEGCPLCNINPSRRENS